MPRQLAPPTGSHTAYSCIELLQERLPSAVYSCRERRACVHTVVYGVEVQAVQARYRQNDYCILGSCHLEHLKTQATTVNGGESESAASSDLAGHARGPLSPHDTPRDRSQRGNER